MRQLRRATVAAAFAFPAATGAAEDPAGLCERAASQGAAAAGIPVQVLQAVALTETGRRQDGRLRPWPWAVNREGRGHWFSSREEALSFARRSIAEGRHSFDLGCFQINYHWHGRHFPSLEAMVDPEAGARYAAEFLRDLRDEFGSWAAAAGAYHSRTPEHATRYRARFERILSDLGGPMMVPASGSSDRPKAPVRRVRGPLIIDVSRGPASVALDAQIIAPETTEQASDAAGTVARAQ